MSVQLTTQRLLLRDLVLDDWPAVHVYATQPEVYRFQPWGPNAPDQSQAFVVDAISEAQRSPRLTYHLAITLRHHHNVIGVGTLLIRSVEHRQGELGYVLQSAAWGRGYATEAARSLLDLGFGTLQLHRIAATCDPRNTASLRVLEKLGMQHEGRLRDAMVVRDGWRDSLLLSLLEQEWHAAHT